MNNKHSATRYEALPPDSVWQSHQDAGDEAEPRHQINKRSFSYIDTHCHLDFPVFTDDLDDVVQNAIAAGVEKIILPAVSASNWQAVYTLTQRYNNIYAAYGLHPMFLAQHKNQHIKDLENFFADHQHPQTVAVGECGLDFFVSGLDRQQQLTFFIAQLKLANTLSLPLIIHARKSLDIILKYSRQYRQTTQTEYRGVIHCFSGSEQQAYQCIEQGFLLGFGGAITYPRAKKLRHLVATLPLESLLLETDAPDQPAAMYYGQRNEPKMLVDIATTIAELRDCDVSVIAEATSYNACTLFGI